MASAPQVPGRRDRVANRQAAKDNPPVPSCKGQPMLDPQLPGPLVMRVALDFGTKTGAAAYTFGPSNQQAELDDVFMTTFARSTYQFPMIAAYVNGNFDWGHSLEAKIRSKELGEEGVIRLFKLALYKDHRTHNIVRHVNTIADLVSDLLAAMYQTIIKVATESAVGRTYDVDNIPKEVFITVPQMWSPNSTRTMTKAAKLAGLPRVELVYEPQAAAAFELQRLLAHAEKHKQSILPYKLTTGDEMLVADLGGGTGDFVAYELTSDASRGARVELRVARDPVGALCGSGFINKAFVRKLPELTEIVNGGGMVSVRKKLGDLSLAAFEAVASEAFERLKTDEPWSPSYGKITLSGTTDYDLVVKIDQAMMRSFFDPVVNEIIRIIDTLVSTETKVIIIPGGFGNSMYLYERLKQRFDPEDDSFSGQRITVFDSLRSAGEEYLPIPCGTLMRYDSISVRGVPAQYSFGVGQVEVWKPNHHPDACWQPGEADEDGEVHDGVTWKVSKVLTDLTDDNDIVEDRWVNLLKKGTMTKPNKFFNSDTWQYQVYYVLDGPTYQVDSTVYWTKGHIKDHEPIFNDDGSRRDDIEEWDTAVVTINPASIGYTQRTLNGRLAYVVWWRLRLECRGANIAVKWQFVEQGTEAYSNMGTRIRRRRNPKNVASEHVFEISDPDFNPFPHQ
ncbi:hypothetical protein LTR85_006782 [Meristemomyces frigidus]|nr:hypothetical protein LTR85_006782 [Meristemomyces frigidus]